MKKLELYIIQLILFISIIVFNFIYKNMVLFNYVVIFLGIYSIIRFGIMKDNNYIKQGVIRIVVSCLLSFLVITYMLGLFLGFDKTTYFHDFKSLFEVVILDVFAIVFEELIRYIICRNTPHKKMPIITYTLILALLNIIIGINGYDLSESERIFIFICTVVLPVISREIVCSYLTYKVSYAPSMIFKLVLSTYGYVFPMLPNLGDYLYAVFNVALPYFTYFFSSKLIDYNKKANVYVKHVTRKVIYIPIYVSLAVLVILISGVFTHVMIAIASNSMKPVYERGDAVIYEKTDARNLKVGEVIAFRKNNIIVTHRIVSISKLDYSYVYRTKGDANNSADDFDVLESEVLGRVKYSIKYIGYPTVLFSEMIRKGK